MSTGKLNCETRYVPLACSRLKRLVPTEKTSDTGLPAQGKEEIVAPMRVGKIPPKPTRWLRSLGDGSKTSMGKVCSSPRLQNGTWKVSPAQDP